MLAIMQGRLSPPADDRLQSFPRETWRREMELAPEAGIGAIEWIYDRYGDGANPIETDAGIAELSELGRRWGVAVQSICADWFMEEPLVHGTGEECRAARERLEWLLGRGSLLGVRRVVLPFVDAVALRSESERSRAVATIGSILPLARQAGTEIHLETSLGPSDFADLLARLDDSWVRVNYDIGNSASLGYRPGDELAAYGHRVGSVHVKDRVLGGSTVALGTGDADFAAVFAGLRALRYRGPFVLQAARGLPGDEVAHTRANVEFTRRFAEVPGLAGVPR